jgi:SAM-dependent methyltransferase
MENGIKIDIGCGRNKPDGFIGIDIVQIIDGKNKKKVDIVMDIEKEALPFDDNSAIEIRAMNVLEHIADLKFVMNEFWRVLSPKGKFYGLVPIAGSNSDFKDPTHVRHFVKGTFDYFTGTNLAFPDQPSHPRYANYGFKPWNRIEITETHEGDHLIKFELTPRK